MSQTTKTASLERKTVAVKVAEFRGAIEELSYWFSSLKSAVGPVERAREAASVKRAAVALMAMDCPRARQDERDEKERLIDITATYLTEAGLAGK
jgi:hypothetical protein